jgi:hypothetical protein
MATIRQIEAARGNGSRSSGPVTADRKASSSQNGLKHGMYSKGVVLSNETTELWDRLVAQYLPEYQPATRPGQDLVLQIANCAWRRNSILTMETAAIDHRMDRQRAEIAAETAQIDEAARAAVAFSTLADRGFTLTLLGRCESRLVRNIARAETRLALLRAGRENKKVKNEPETVP